MGVEKVAVVTGATSEIGAALCRQLVTAGVCVVAADGDAARLRQLSQGLDGAARYTQVVDAADDDRVRRLLTGTVADLGRLDYLFNTADLRIDADFGALPLGRWQDMVEVDLWGMVHGTRHGYAVMRAQGFGHIVNTVSVAGLLPTARSVAYAMTQHAVVGLTTSLRAEAAGTGVRISVAVPGATPTRSTEQPRKLLRRKPIDTLAPDRAACAIMRGMRRNQQYIIVPRYSRAMIAAYRWFPNLVGGLLAPRHG
ncbi:SDR family NAD(P)-dependent oxidoreductase [Nocardia cyriacigeorgica]|uniref:SDR family NAD(P)-dependent oxidoreductase n=1 Tax=Nocardia cyriacigeorgica TaxID=135487 RepID=UPI0018944763|nr:SDR family NAD(P)-dependent oxidoreductase [Nocardia cyriacigeorgica]MBF6096618.1 SDR family NAD(P)-dependent oxidoreductase [Nocardia cyriacigeorgica]MBF6162515.1 SDR family NAD(P)-dependent oxidoreductase [Nocardia cyriacigeorgica]MBF6201501.1 SDR family NAD(P)-dependent oxidoreductase [Nocardia cyriacigeorgica]MBF6317082.1 SDR family NAD(P)-dependent oxidoreductase [Nocardia cyriacigeorgica]MBF6532366.1 SDR family NAD(P)-dependent oxidoreductase [Nocardia cyriacigeorgica]